MLEKVDLSKKLSKEEYKQKMPQLEARLGRLQRECKALEIPVMIVFEGFGAAGKGLQIGQIGGQAEDGHDLAGHGDIKSVLPGRAVGLAAQTVGDEPQL